MDASRFDRLARVLASATTRRSSFLSLLTAPFALVVSGAEAAPRSRKRGKKKNRARRGTSARAGSPSTHTAPGNAGSSGNAGGNATTANVPACSRTWRVCSAALAQAGADLRGCDFTRQRLVSPDLSGALLDGASLRG